MKGVLIKPSTHKSSRLASNKSKYDRERCCGKKQVLTLAEVAVAALLEAHIVLLPLRPSPEQT